MDELLAKIQNIKNSEEDGLFYQKGLSSKCNVRYFLNILRKRDTRNETKYERIAD